MPRHNPRRPSTAVRLGDDVLDQIDVRALQEGLLKGNGDPNRSEIIRLCIEYALEYMPKGWLPSGDSDAIGNYLKYDQAIKKTLKGARPKARAS